MTEQAAPQSLIDIADYLLAVYDDLLDDDEEIDELTDAIALDIVRRNYLSGTCQAFAIALHEHLGYPIVALNGGLHVAVRCPDGQLMDFDGVAPLAKVAKRYGWKGIIPVEIWTKDETMAHLVADEDADEDPWSDASMARWVRAHLDRWQAVGAPKAEAIPGDGAPTSRRPRRSAR